MNKKSTNTYLSKEATYELNRLAKLWELSKSQANEKAVFIAGALCRKSSDRTITIMAKERMHEAGLEMVHQEKGE